MSEAELRTVWLEAGRPGVDKFYAAALRGGLAIKRKDAQEFVKKQETRQVFAPGPVSSGNVTASRIDDRWQVDLIDWKQMDASKNNGYKNVLVVVDVFSRFAWAIPMENKTTEVVVNALEGIMRGGRKPSEVDTDGGLEFGARFTSFLEGKKIAHKKRLPSQPNGLAVVDAVIKRLKETLVKDLAEEGTQDWIKFLPGAIKAHNSNSHEHLMGSSPDDVGKTPGLQYFLEKQAGLDAAKNFDQHASRVAELRKYGAFRVLLKGKTFNRATTANWSNEVHKVREINGGEVEDDKGRRFSVRECLPVPLGSKNAKASADVGSDAKRDTAKELLTLFAQALNGMLGDEGLTLQGAGIKLRPVPGFSEAMAEAKVTGVGALERFIRLFPDMFVVEGEGQKKRVRRGVVE